MDVFEDQHNINQTRTIQVWLAINVHGYRYQAILHFFLTLFIPKLHKHVFEERGAWHIIKSKSRGENCYESFSKEWFFLITESDAPNVFSIFTQDGKMLKNWKDKNLMDKCDLEFEENPAKENLHKFVRRKQQKEYWISPAPSSGTQNLFSNNFNQRTTAIILTDHLMLKRGK